MIEMETDIDGKTIPFLVEADGFISGCEGNLSGSNDNCFPPEPDEVEFTVYKLNEKSYPWLEKRLSSDDIDRIEATLFLQIEEQRLHAEAENKAVK